MPWNLAHHLFSQPFGRRTRPARKTSRRFVLETLEARVTPTVTSAVAAGVLTVSSDFDDSITIAASSGDVLINGDDPGTGAAAASTITGIVVNSGPAASFTDFSSVLKSTFPNLTHITYTGNSSADTVYTSPQFPGSYTEALGDGNDQLFINDAASYTNFTEDDLTNPGTRSFSFDGTQITANFTNVFDAVRTSTATLITSDNGNTERIGESNTPNNGTSLLITPATGVSTFFRNPSDSLDVQAHNPIVFAGLDPVNTPKSILIDGGSAHAGLQLTGNATNVTFLFGDKIVNVDGQEIGIPNVGQLTDSIVTRNLTFVGQASQILSDDPGPPGNGISRIEAPSLGLHADFLNPTGTLTVIQDGANTSFTYSGIDPIGAPSNIVFQGSSSNPILNLTGRASSVAIDFHASLLKIDTTSVTFSGFGDINDNITSKNLTFLANGYEILSDNGNPTDGISRLSAPFFADHTDFINPTGTLTIAGAGGSSTFAYDGMDNTGRPAAVVFNGDSGYNALQFNGVANSQAFVFGLGTQASFDGQVIYYTTFRGGETDNVTSNYISFQLSPGAHEIISDGFAPNDGYSRDTNQNSGLFINFKNPAVQLSVVGNVGNTVLTFAGLDRLNPPQSVRFKGAPGANTLLRTSGGLRTRIHTQYVQIFLHVPNRPATHAGMPAIATAHRKPHHAD